MNKLLICLSALLVLFVSGCAPSSAPTPKKVDYDKSSEYKKNKKFYKINSNDAAKYKKACDLNNGSSCAKLGILYCKGDGVKKDKDMCKKYITKACELNDGMGCNHLGLIEIYDSPANWLFFYSRSQDYYFAAKYFAKACELNDGMGCNNLADAYKNGKGVKQDYSKAMKYYKKGCELGDTYGCGRYKELKRKGY